MSIISIVLVVIVAFLAGMEGILDEFQFHQPLVACTLIGLVTGNLEAGIILGGTLQMIALGWANIGAEAVCTGCCTCFRSICHHPGSWRTGCRRRWYRPSQWQSHWQWQVCS